MLHVGATGIDRLDRLDRLDGRTDGWMDGWMDRQKYSLSKYSKKAVHLMGCPSC
jgi:hypothetical protein